MHLLEIRSCVGNVRRYLPRRLRNTLSTLRLFLMFNLELRELIAARSEVRFGYTRPDWHGIRADVEMAGGDFQKLATAAARMWGDVVANEYGKGAKVHVEATRTYALLPASEATEKAQRWVEHCISELRVFLSGIVSEQDEHLVVLIFDDSDAFVTYVIDIYTAVGDEHGEAEELAHYGSNYCSDGFPQIVAPVHDGGGESGLAHDVTCSMLEHLTLPAWLYSGIAQSMVGLLTKRDMRPSAREMTAAHRFWKPESMQRFWSGASFSDSYAGSPSHTMAFLFVQALSGSYERLVRLVTNPGLSRADAGDAAFHAEYGNGLENLASRLLGAGPWAPNVAAIAEIHADVEAGSDQVE